MSASPGKAGDIAEQVKVVVRLREKIPKSVSLSVIYDGADNRILRDGQSTDRTIGASDRPAEDALYTYTYDANGVKSEL